MPDDSPEPTLPVAPPIPGGRKPLLRRLLGRPWPDLDVLVLKSRTCPLCDEAVAELGRLAPGLGLRVRAAFIHDDPALERRYREEVPVVFVQGRKLGIGRVDRWQLRRRVEAVRAALASR